MASVTVRGEKLELTPAEAKVFEELLEIGMGEDQALEIATFEEGDILPPLEPLVGGDTLPPNPERA